ncbi:PTS transporter subunit EIIC [Aureibacillus halotolerans]|uniref:PTS system IIB component (Glc family) /PTS system IIC component (Glc family) n=1 Tax=Aureibacillus halotolerans TaxID=1508390 RepID=A0A4R6TYL4_9BACI|nr:PTS transporter subunit EIIC [Aureibacillus halotolerans]TDQ37129.1 PTS system IIB component (Glc family) /PTS system IIC component (Glc family) [Aureibacillus halotolerans]
MKEQELVKHIIRHVGGEENIKKAWHCMTRLRLDLHDFDKIDHAQIKNLDGVMGEQVNNNQYQIIIGTHVQKVHTALMDELGDTGEEDNKASSSSSGQKKGLFSRLLDVVSGVFGPIVPAIAGAGMIKGILAGLIALNVLNEESDTVIILDLIASAVFHFLPFFLAASAAKIFKTNQYLAIAVAGGFMYPSLMEAAKAGEIAQYQFIGLPVPVLSYAATVIPIILSVWALSYIERYVDRWMPNALRTVFTPTLTLFIAIPVALIVAGPLGAYVGDLLAAFIEWLFAVSSILAGAVVGGIRPIAIVFGMHHAMTPIALQNFVDNGYDMLMPMMFMANMAICGATLAVFFKTKDKKEKSVILSAAISALLGITEPALFGVLIKNRRAFIACTVGSMAASIFIALFGVRIYGYILSSIVSLVAYVGPYFMYAVIGIIIAIGVAFALTFATMRKREGVLE